MALRCTLRLLAPVILLSVLHAQAVPSLEDARRALQQRNWRAAADQFESILKSDPKSADAHIGLGIARFGAGDRDAALAEFQQATKLNPGSPQAHYNVALALRDAGEMRAAIASVQRAINLKPDYDDARLALGLMLQQEGDVAAGITQYRLVLKRNPRSADAHNWLGVAFMQKNQLNDAIAEFRRAIQLKPGFARAYNNLGSTLAQAGNVEEGVQAFESGLRYAPDDLQLHLNLGSALRAKGNSERAIQHLQFVVKRSPDDPEVHYQIGQALRQSGELDAAVRAFEAALGLNPEYRDSYYNLGQTLRQIAARHRSRTSSPAEPHVAKGLDSARANDLPAALASFSRAVELDGDSWSAHYNLGAALWYSNQKERAAEELDAAIRLNPAATEAYSLRAIAYRDAGDLENARRALQRAMALNPMLPVTYFDLALVFLRAGRLDRALGQFEAGLNLPQSLGSPPDLEIANAELRSALAAHDSSEGRIILGRLLGLGGADPKPVLAEFEAALRLKPGSAEAHNHMALVYTQTGNDEKAIAAFREAIRLRPDYADAHANLGAILTTTDVAASVKELEKAVALRPDLLKAQYNLALAYGASPETAGKEIATLEKLIATDSAFPRAEFALGKALLRKGSLQEAVTHLQRAVQAEPQYGEAHYQLGLALARTGQREQSAAALEKGRQLIAATQSEQTLLLDLKEGREALDKGEIQQARQKFERVLQHRPDLAEARRLLEQTNVRATAAIDDSREVKRLEEYFRKAKYAEAQQALNVYVKEHPDSAWGWYALGYSYFGQQKIGESIRALSKSLSLDVKNAEAHKVLGRNLMLIGRFDSARIEFEQGVKYGPKSAEMHYNLGKLYSIQDQWPAARNAFELALKLDPDYMEAYDGLGFAFEALGEDAAAISNYEKAAQLNAERKGTFANPYVNLSALHNRSSNFDAALEFARKAIAVNPKSDRAWFQMARALERRAEIEPAIDAVKRAIEINARVSSYYYVLGTLYRRSGKSQDSRQAMEMFSKLDRETNQLEEKRREGLRQ